MNKHGVYSSDDLKALIASGRLTTLQGFQEKHIGPASIDLTVSGGCVYEVDRILKPNGHRNETVRGLLPYMTSGDPESRKRFLGEVMHPGKMYLAKAPVDVNFSPGLYAYANAKSTSGRNFLLVRVLADFNEGFDTMDKRRGGLSCEVWFVMQPLVFPIVLTDEEAYIQMRVFDGDTRFSENDLRDELLHNDFLYRHNNEKYEQGDLSLFAEDGSIFTTLYAKAGKLVGFRAKSSYTPLDLRSRGLDPRPYFEPVYGLVDPSNQDGGLVDIVPLQYYLFSPNEKLKVMVDLSSELSAMHPRFGLFFSHFAGFFDPGFYGAPTLEVATFVPTTIRHKEPVARFVFERMRSRTLSYADVGNYAGQSRTTLPKQFEMPKEWQDAMD